MKKTLIIAEAGVNHNGSLEMAKELVSASKDCGADIVKFQTFQAENLVTADAKQADYQKSNTGIDESQFNLLKKLELSFDEFVEISQYCQSFGIEFLSTAFDETSLQFLVDNFKMNYLKIPSGEITNLPFILTHARTKKDIIISTGMANLEEINDALATIYFGYFSSETPSVENIRSFYLEKQNINEFKKKVTVLHCTTEYPTPLEQVNLNVIKTLKSELELNIGYSDHTAGVSVAPLAVAAGAEVIEKHLTLNKSLPGPDHKASLNPDEFKEMSKRIREAEIILGSFEKKAQECELKNMTVARKSLVAISDIKIGEKYTSANLGVKRPGDGIAPAEFWNTLGRKAVKACKAGDLIIL